MESGFWDKLDVWYLLRFMLLMNISFRFDNLVNFESLNNVFRSRVLLVYLCDSFMLLKIK